MRDTTQDAEVTDLLRAHDRGIARLAELGVTGFHKRPGEEGYMAPERAPSHERLVQLLDIEAAARELRDESFRNDRAWIPGSLRRLDRALGDAPAGEAPDYPMRDRLLAAERVKRVSASYLADVHRLIQAVREVLAEMNLGSDDAAVPGWKRELEYGLGRGVRDERRILRFEPQVLRSLLGEGFHTAFRKATDAPLAMPIHRLLSELDSDDWDAVLSFVMDGLSYGTTDAPEPESRKGLASERAYRLARDTARRHRNDQAYTVAVKVVEALYNARLMAGDDDAPAGA